MKICNGGNSKRCAIANFFYFPAFKIYKNSKKISNGEPHHGAPLLTFLIFLFSRLQNSQKKLVMPHHPSCATANIFLVSKIKKKVSNDAPDVSCATANFFF